MYSLGRNLLQFTHFDTFVILIMHHVSVQHYMGQWGSVCGGAFDIVTADAACITLGYTKSRSAPRLAC